MSTHNETEELSVTFSDVSGPLSQPVLEDRIEDIVQESLNYREVFRSYPAQNINSNVVQLPVPKEEIGEPKLIEEGAEFPRDQENYELRTLEFDKFGFEVAITMEAQEDSQVNLVRDQVDRQARQMREDMNERAFDEINEASLSSVSSNSNGTFEFDDLLEGRNTLMEGSYSPDLLIANTEAVHDLLGTDFLDATNEGAQMRRSGEVGQIAGMSIVEDDSALDFGGNGGSEALMVDTDFFGYEGVRTPVTAEEYEEMRSQSDVYRIYSRMGWVVMDDDAAVVIEG